MTVQTGTLERVYVRPPNTEALSSWRAYGWHREPDPDAIATEHSAFREALAAAGAEVICSDTAVDGDPDAVYAYDPVLMTPAGAIPLRPGKEGRRSEPHAELTDLERAAVPVLKGIRPPGTAEGGDMFFLDEGTLAVGRGYRTNDAGIDQLRALLPDVEVLAFDLPHLNGPAECLHLMSFISPLDTDLAVGYAPLMPVRLMETLADRGIELVEVPEEEFDTMGPNVLALGGRRALALEGNPETKRRMEAAGVDVRTYRGEEVSRNGDGGPTCLTLPLVRG
ncbi:MAG: dimethylarginine dimethylaminohydrolase family protein [Actinomycetota bacterium]